MALSSISKHRGADADLALEVGRRVRAAREARGLSQAEVGQPFSRAFISLVEAGRTVPSLPALMHIAERLGIDPCWLLPAPRAPQGRYTPPHEDDHPPSGAPPG